MKKSQRKVNTKKILLIVVFAIIIIAMPSFARYTYNNLKDMYLASKEFFFTSDLIGKNITYSNWGGTENYTINFELYSYENELRRMENELSCKITAKVTTNNATCYIESSHKQSEGAEETILEDKIDKTNDNNILNVKLHVSPKEAVPIGEVIKIEITAEATAPYTKKLKTTITLTATNQSDYEIVDEIGKDYAELVLSNTKSEDVEVTLEFDPNIVKIDLNNNIFADANTQYTTQDIENESYIKNIKFKVSKESSKRIKFYKTSKTSDYTYTNNQNNTSESIINVTF